MHGPGPDLTLDYTRNMCSAEEFGALPRTREAAKEARLRVWEALQDLKAQGKVRSIGISNFVRRHIEDIVKDKRYYGRTSGQRRRRVEAISLQTSPVTPRACTSRSVLT